MEYTGENLLPGQLGEFFIALSFGAAILSAVAYFFAAQTGETSWKSLARKGFIIHGLSVFSVIGLIFYLLLTHQYEYNYIYKYSSDSMPTQYVFSAFWSGQEGSFLLWSFWHIILGGIFIWREKKWETHTMTIIMLVQVFISSMLLGVYFWDYKFGSNPFILTRELPEALGLSWTQSERYLELVFPDGRGLNPLLQNYWMTIHPPTLFLGFASTVVPFSFAIAGLWKKDLAGWIKPALPWTYFSVMILGTGILMGGAWAYESLTFGGFWAWDPVENASLVPWIVLVAGAHIMLINKHKPKSLFSAFLFILLSFIFVLYSTFLTRSGILGDSSVHSFVESGILPQLLVYLLFFLGLSVYFLNQKAEHRKVYLWSCVAFLVLGILFYVFDSEAVRFEHAPAGFVVLFVIISLVYLVIAYTKSFRNNEDEPVMSREFWMFIGGLVLFLSAMQITFWMSIPVANEVTSAFRPAFQELATATTPEAKPGMMNPSGWSIFEGLAKGNFSIGADVVNTYNRWQIPFVLLITLFIGFSQFLKWGKTDSKKWFRQLLLSIVVSAIATLTIILLGFRDATYFSNYFLLFSSIFCVVANTDFLFRILKGNIKKGGAAIAHVGFGLLILGALYSQSQQDVISKTSGTDISALSRESNSISSQNDQLMYLGDTLVMGDYMTSYTGYDTDGRNAYYHIDYYSQQPNSYAKDDVVFHMVTGQPTFFIAKDDHQASASLVEDIDPETGQWFQLPVPTEKQLDRAEEWKAFKPKEKLFTLSPRLQLNETFGNANEPDTKHYLDKDLFTYLKFAQTEKVFADTLGYLKPQKLDLFIGDTLSLSAGIFILDSVQTASEDIKKNFLPTDLVLTNHFRFVSEEIDTLLKANFLVRGNQAIGETIFLEKERIIIRIEKNIPKADKFGRQVMNASIEYTQHKDNFADFIVMRAIVFPQINILWIGCIIMIIGTVIAIIERRRTNRISRPVSKL